MKNRKRSTAVFAAGILLTGSLGLAQQGQGTPQPRGLSDIPAASPAQQERPGAAGQAAGAGGDQWQQQMQKIAQSQGDAVGDKLFILDAAMGSQFEMELARLAERKSQNQQVKQIAQRIVQDHQQAAQRLMPIAQKHQIEIPQTLPQSKQMKLRIMESLDAQMFDQKFVATMDALHAHDVAMFQHASQLLRTDDVKQFAAQTLPKLREHHQGVTQVASAVGLQAGHGSEAQPAGSRIPGQQPAGNQPRPGGASERPDRSTPGGTGTTPGGTTPDSTTPDSSRPAQPRPQ